MGVPFQLIFSIIIIVAVIVVSFFVIRMFLERAEQAKFEDSVAYLKDEILSVWRSDRASKTIELKTSSKPDSVCFANLSDPNPRGNMVIFNELDRFNGDSNFFFYPLGVAEEYESESARNIKCSGKECIKILKNPICFENRNGKISIKLEKKVGDPYVIITNP